MAFRIGVDVGGTFIDLVVADENSGCRLYKTLSDPSDLAGALLDGLTVVAENEGITLVALLGRTEMIVHGSTVATNALITRTGAKTALLTTVGFRDVLNMRRGLRQNQYDPKQEPPHPLIPRQLIFPIEERIDCEGLQLTPVSGESLDAALTKLVAEGIESVAVGFVFAFLNGSHEEQVGAKLREVMPHSHVSLSSEVLPEVRLYERLSTTAVNAYVTPVLGRYLRSLEARLKDSGFTGRLLIMQSNGGVMGLDVGEQFGVRSILSGPAAGPVAGIAYAGRHDLSNAITMDMGGTSFDVCLVKGGDIEVTKEMEIAGHRIALPMVGVHTIGAGGGSIVKLDGRGLLQVGPESAGSTPGPACYGRGGERPTVTDANLLVGYLGVERFWGGRLRLNETAAYEAFEQHVAKPLGMDVIDAAYGAYRIVNANMVDAIREVSVRRGHDPREFLLVAAGGAGPIHVGAIAQELDAALVLIPREASVMCAMGQLLSDLRHDFVRGHVAPLNKPNNMDDPALLDLDIVNGLFGDMKVEAIETLLSEGLPRERMDLSLSADVRYVGQFSEVEVPFKTEVVTPEAVRELVRDFHALHESLNGYSMHAGSTEVVNLRVVGRGIVEQLQLPGGGARRSGSSSALTGHRKAFFLDRFVEVPVYDGFQLCSGESVVGPAIVEQDTTTAVVQPGHKLTCDMFGNYFMHTEGLSLAECIATLKEGKRNEG